MCTSQRTFCKALGALALTALLTGCALPIRLDNAVVGHAAWPPHLTQAPAAPNAYLFERLPSQNTPEASAQQTQLESWARQALAEKQWTLAAEGAAAPWRVQVSGETQTMASPTPPIQLGSPWLGSAKGDKRGVFRAPLLSLEPPYYLRRFQLIIREAQSGQVVYETQAQHDGPWGASEGIWQALMGASLAGFPNPAKGTQRVITEVPARQP